MLALTAATEIELTLDVRYSYRVTHLGTDVSGNDDANSAKSAWLSTVTGRTGDRSAEDEKYEIVDGTSENIGPGISTLYVVSSANADGVIQFARLGTPTISY